MKKWVTSILTMVFVLSLSASSVHAAEGDYQKVLNDVNKANGEINEMIRQSIDEAEKEADDYIKNLQILQYGKDVLDLDNQISNLQEQLCNFDSSMKDCQDKCDKVSKQLYEKQQQRARLIEKREEKSYKLLGDLDELKTELNNLDNDNGKSIKIKGVINKLEAQIDKPNKETQELTDKFNDKIDRIILRLINDTNKKASDMKERAAEKGFTVICELIPVEINGETFWIDPLRVACF